MHPLSLQLSERERSRPHLAGQDLPPTLRSLPSPHRGQELAPLPAKKRDKKKKKTRAFCVARRPTSRLAANQQLSPEQPQLSFCTFFFLFPALSVQWCSSGVSSGTNRQSTTGRTLQDTAQVGAILQYISVSVDRGGTSCVWTSLLALPCQPRKTVTTRNR